NPPQSEEPAAVTAIAPASADIDWTQSGTGQQNTRCAQWDSAVDEGTVHLAALGEHADKEAIARKRRKPRKLTQPTCRAQVVWIANKLVRSVGSKPQRTAEREIAQTDLALAERRPA